MTFDPIVANPHVQTLLGAGLRGFLPCPAGQVQVIACPNSRDGFPCYFCPSNGPLGLLVVHGIGGDARSGLGVSLAGQWLRRGLGPVLLVSLSPVLSPESPARLYHGSSTDSLGILYQWLHQRSQSCVAVGFSLGANILVKWLSQSKQPGLRTGVSVCNPWNLKECGQHLETTTMGRFYRFSMVERLKKRALQLCKSHPRCLDRDAILKSRTFYDYDMAVTAPLHGFIDVEDYYQRSSSWSCVDQLQNPLLSIDARDDPFRSPGVRLEDLPPSVERVTTPAGGHLGFLGRRKTFFWLEDYLCRRAQSWTIP